MSTLHQSTPAYPLWDSRMGEPRYNTVVKFDFDPAGYAAHTADLQINYSGAGLPGAGHPIGRPGDCGILVRSGDTSLGCYVWLTWYDRGPNNNEDLGEYHARSFKIAPEQLVAAGQALISMGMTEMARAQMTEQERVDAAVDNIRSLADEQMLEKPDIIQLRKQVQRDLTRRIR